jgi:uncharacterized protein YqeY
MEEIRKETLLYEIECALEKVKEEKAKLIAADKNAEVPKAVNDRISSLVLIKSELIRENKKHHKDYELTKEEEIVELSRMAGAREQNVKDYKNNGRLDLAEADANELAIIKEFLPYVPEGEELKEFINNMIDTYLSEQAEGYKPSIRDMGKIKSLVNATYPSVSGNIIKDVLMGRINGSNN